MFAKKSPVGEGIVPGLGKGTNLISSSFRSIIVTPSNSELKEILMYLVSPCFK